MTRLAVLAAVLAGGACALARPGEREPLVDLAATDASIRVDIRYATKDNFTKEILHPVNRCLLRTTVAKRLRSVQADLAAQGLGLKVWDCYRPLSIQRKLWALVPDPRYVADPAKGSRHNRGAAVDVTVVDPTGAELEMPSAYDDFSPRAHRDFTGAPAAALARRRTLDAAMTRQGFEGLPTEWWHFDAKGWKRYPVLDSPLAP